MRVSQSSSLNKEAILALSQAVSDLMEKLESDGLSMVQAELEVCRIAIIIAVDYDVSLFDEKWVKRSWNACVFASMQQV